MRTKLCIATALAGSLLLAGAVIVAGSAEAAPTPVLKGDAPDGVVTLVKRGGPFYRIALAFGPKTL